MEVIYNAELCPNYFSVNVSVLAVVFRQTHTYTHTHTDTDTDTHTYTHIHTKK